MPSRNCLTAAEGMMKLNPCTLPPSLWVTKVRTPITSPAMLIAGPPLVPASAAASVCMTA